MKPDLQKIREQLWQEYLARGSYSEDYKKTYLAGLFAAWRVIGLDNRPLFTFDGSGTPVELK